MRSRPSAAVAHWDCPEPPTDPLEAPAIDILAHSEGDDPPKHGAARDRGRSYD